MTVSVQGAELYCVVRGAGPVCIVLCNLGTALVERQMPSWGKAGSRDKAMAILGCLVGTLLMARLVDDPQLSRTLRKAARDFIRGAAR